MSPRRMHGQSGTNHYRAWNAMIRRCTEPNHVSYKWYGARGITVCERWLSYADYFADVGLRPPGMTLDRIDNDGNYEPGNCRWATPHEQNMNRRPELVRPAHCRNGHAYAGNTYHAPDGSRKCRTCHANALDRYRARELRGRAAVRRAEKACQR